ncbi:MAG: hypothetical protein ACRC46_10380 [Thermoguttaceae bacterium]
MMYTTHQLTRFSLLASRLFLLAIVAAWPLCAIGNVVDVIESVEWEPPAVRGRTPEPFPTSRILASRLVVGGEYVVELDCTMQAGTVMEIRVDLSTESDDDNSYSPPLAAVVVTTSPYHDGETVETARLTFVVPPRTTYIVAGNESRDIAARWHAATESLRRLTPRLGVARDDATPKLVVSATNLTSTSTATPRRVRLMEAPPHAVPNTIPTAPQVSQRQYIAYLSDFALIARGDIESLFARLRRGRYDAAVVSVAHAGESLYPSRFWDFSTTGDVLALLSQLFARDGIGFIPMLDLATPLPPLEEMIARDPSLAPSVLLTNSTGEILRQQLPPKTRMPHYNILSPRVQDVVLAAIDELAQTVERSGQRSGVAVLLSGDGYAVLPDESWGCDAATISAFADVTGIVIDPSLTLKQRSEIVLTQNKEAWTKWRCDRVRDFYGRAAAVVASRVPTARLFLIGDEMLTGEVSQQSLTPSLPRRTTTQSAMRRVGFDFRDAWDPRIVLPRCVHSISPLAPLAESATQREVESDINSDTFFSTTTSSLFVHHATSPEASDNVPIAVVEFGVPAAARYARHLAVADVQDFLSGGDVFPPCFDRSLRNFLMEWQKLPRVAFTSLDPSPPQPLVFRTASVGGTTWAYAVNASSVPITAEVMLSAPAGKSLASDVTLSGGVTRLATAGAAATHSWRLALGPYSIRAVQLGDNVKVTEIVLEKLSQTTPAEATLKDRVTTMATLVRSAKRGVRSDLLVNADFESPLVSGTLNGWQAFGDESFVATLDQSHAASGQKSLVLHSPRGAVGAGVVSTPFALPPTGRLFVLAQVGIEDTASGLVDSAAAIPLRFVVVGCKRGSHETFCRASQTVVPQGDETVKDGVRWRRVVVPIDLLPLNGADDARLVIEPIHSSAQNATVWIDDLATYSVAFTVAELNELMRRSALASQRLEERKLTSLETSLDGFWFAYLRDYVPLETSAPNQTTSQPANTATSPTPPTFLQRMRSIVPF